MLVYNKSQIDPIEIVNLLESGLVLCYPTETLYGLGCRADNKDAIKRIYEIKKREKEKNFTLLFKDLNMIKDFCNLKYLDENLILEFSPGPFSILLQAKESKSIDRRLVSSNNEVCCRISSHPFTTKLFEFLNYPIISTSANVSGNKNIFLFKTIYNTFDNLVDYIVDYGDIEKSLGSTIVRNAENGLTIIREGDLNSKKIKDFYNGKG